MFASTLQDKSTHPSVYERPPIKSPMVKRRKNGTTSSVKNVQIAVLGKDGVGKSGQLKKAEALEADLRKSLLIQLLSTFSLFPSCSGF